MQKMIGRRGTREPGCGMRMPAIIPDGAEGSAPPLAGHTLEDFTLVSQYPTQPRGAALFEPRRMGMSYTARQEGKRIMGRNDRIRPDPVADPGHPRPGTRDAAPACLPRVLASTNIEQVVRSCARSFLNVLIMRGA